MKYKHLFGPVQSRRLGKSLGIDLIPFKTCSLDCVFCECGKTTCLTTKKKDYISTDEVIRELKDLLKDNPPIDYLTFSGAGEPTLASNLGTIINFLKDNYPQYKVCVLTNGTLLWDPIIRKRIIRADVVVPSLNSAVQETYLKINRPTKELSVDKVIDGIVAFRQEFKGKIFLEIFIVPGLNDTIDELTALKAAVATIQPELIQLNSLDRAGSEAWIKRPSPEQMQKIQEFFKPFKAEIFVKPIEVPLPPQRERSAGRNQTA